MTYTQWTFPKTQSFYYGLALPLHALKTIISHPKLIFLSLIPTLITFALYSFFFVELHDYFQVILNHLFIQLGINIHGWLAQVLMFLMQALLFLLSVFTFSFICNLIAIPFNDFLAEYAESYTYPPLKAVTDLNLKKRINIMGIDLMRSLVTLLCDTLVFFLSWVPGINLLVLIFAFLLVTFQYISYPQSRRSQGMKAGVSFLFRHPLASLGFGISFSVLLSIPFLSSFCFPLAVVGGTLLFARGEGSPTLPKLQ
jgi:CysZ protein